ncbi:GIP, partial [Symbiodinium pilosum]
RWWHRSTVLLRSAPMARWCAGARKAKTACARSHRWPPPSTPSRRCEATVALRPGASLSMAGIATTSKTNSATCRRWLPRTTPLRPFAATA